MARLFGLCSGDPFGARSYSGSSRQLYLALERAGGLGGAADVDHGKSHRRLAWARTILATRRIQGRRLLVRWTPDEMERRSRRAADLLARAGADVTGVLMYGTDFFPAPVGERARVPVGAGLDTTFAQLARSAEDKFAMLTPDEIEQCVDRQRRVFERCAWLFPRSAWCARSLLDDYDVPRSKLVVTAAGPNFDQPAPERAAGSYDRRTILFVGRDWHRKHGPLVLDGFRLARAERPDLRLVIVGPTKFRYSAPGVEWLGALDGDARAQLSRLYSEASLLLCPSRFEPFGIAILEGMAAGCPAVALAHGAARELIEDGVTGSLLAEAEPRALAETILHWLADAARLEQAGRAARERVRRHYSWDFAARRILAAFDGRLDAPSDLDHSELGLERAPGNQLFGELKGDGLGLAGHLLDGGDAELPHPGQHLQDE